MFRFSQKQIKIKEALNSHRWSHFCPEGTLVRELVLFYNRLWREETWRELNIIRTWLYGDRDKKEVHWGMGKVASNPDPFILLFRWKGLLSASKCLYLHVNVCCCKYIRICRNDTYILMFIIMNWLSCLWKCTKSKWRMGSI